MQDEQLNDAELPLMLSMDKFPGLGCGFLKKFTILS